MITVIIWKEHQLKQDWLWFKNEYYFEEHPFEGEDSMSNIVDNLFGFESGLHFSTTNYIGAAIRYGTGGATGSSGTQYKTYRYHNKNEYFYRQPTGEPFWRWQLGMRKATMSGRHSQSRYVNCICEEDTFTDSTGRLGLSQRNYFDRWISDHHAAAYNSLWKYEVTHQRGSLSPTGSGTVPVLERYGAYAVDSHAQTRWRRRQWQAGHLMFKRGAEFLLKVEQAIYNNISWISYDIDYVPSHVWEETTAALEGVVQIHSAYKDYFEDCNRSNQVEPEPPNTRFGTTGDHILEGMREWKTWAEEKLPEMKARIKPVPYLDGKSYIKSSELNDYDEKLRGFRDKAGALWFFDWMNPRASSTAGDLWLPSSTPDALELQF